MAFAAHPRCETKQGNIIFFLTRCANSRTKIRLVILVVNKFGVNVCTNVLPTQVIETCTST